MWIGKTTPETNYFKVGPNMITFLSKMKALGILIQGDLSWDAQTDYAIDKSKKLLAAFRFLRKYLTESQFLKAASANYYGSVFYACGVWYNSLKQVNKYYLRLISDC